MARNGFLITGPAPGITQFNAAVTRKAGPSLGQALRAASSHRAFISADALKRVRTTLGEREFEKLLTQTELRVIREVDEIEAVALMKTRDPADLAARPDLRVSPVRDPDTGLMLDWHLVECGFPAAWKLFDGIESIDWTGIAVGHIDTGFTHHPALGFAADDGGGSEWVDTVQDANFFSLELDTSTGMPTFAQSDSAEDRELAGLNGGHGTRTMSVLCGFDTARRATAGGYSGYFGGAPRVPVVPVRLQDAVWLQGLALSDDLPDAIDHLVDTAGVDIITLSMGGPLGTFLTSTTPQRLRAAIDKAYEKGVIVCCAAGNNIPNEHVVFPARSSRTIAVAGTAPDRKLWVGSSYGIQVDVAAPAFPIRRADVSRSASGFEFGYDVGDGTSFATPQVAAAAALWFARHGAEIESTYTQKWQRVQAFKSLLQATARRGEAWDDSVHGAGILDVGALLSAALPEASSLAKDVSQDWN
jgi:subtilisin family serine protease